MAAAAFFFLLWLAAALKAETVVVINELKSDTPGPDVGEFIELYAYESTSGHAAAFFPLDGYLVVFFNGASPSRAAAASPRATTAPTRSLRIFLPVWARRSCTPSLANSSVDR